MRARSDFVTQSSATGATRCARKRRAGDPLVRLRLQAVRLRRGGPLSVVREMTLVQDLCAGAHQRGVGNYLRGGCRSTAGHPKASSHELRRERRMSQRFAAVSCGSSSTGRSRVCAFMLPSHTITSAARTPVHPGRNREPTRRHNETGECKPSRSNRQHTPKRPPARSGPACQSWKASQKPALLQHRWSQASVGHI